MNLHVEIFEPVVPVRQHAVRPALSVVWCHGLPSGTVRDAKDPGYPGLARDCAERGWAAAAFDFRGAYRSGGDFSLAGWIDDLRDIIAMMRARFDAPIAVVGSSLGGSVTLLEAAREANVDLVATLAAPANFNDLEGDAGAMFMAQVHASQMFRTPGYPDDMHAWHDEFRTHVPSIAAARIERPALIVHGTADDVVDVAQARVLFEAMGGPVTLVTLDGAGHQLRRNATAIRVVHAWLAAHA